MILGRNKILEMIERGKIRIDPLFDDTVRENGIDLRLGNEYMIYTVEGACVDLSNASQYLKKYVRDIIMIPPHSFVLVTTLERVELSSDVIGFCNLRSSYARLGLSIPPTIVDAGFRGQLTIEIVNNTDNIIKLRSGERFLHLVFAYAEGAVEYCGKYQNQTSVTPPK